MATIEASDSWAAPADSSAALAICCMALCNSSAALAASVTPPANSWVAAARRPATVWGAPVWRLRLRGAAFAAAGAEAGVSAFRAPRLLASSDVFTSAIYISRSHGILAGGPPEALHGRGSSDRAGKCARRPCNNYRIVSAFDQTPYAVRQPDQVE